MVKSPKDKQQNSLLLRPGGKKEEWSSQSSGARATQWRTRTVTRSWDDGEDSRDGTDHRERGRETLWLYISAPSYVLPSLLTCQTPLVARGLGSLGTKQLFAWDSTHSELWRHYFSIFMSPLFRTLDSYVSRLTSHVS